MATQTLEIPKLDECKPGLRAAGFNVIVAMQPIMTRTVGGVELADSYVEKQRLTQVRGRIVDVSPVAFDNAVYPAGSKPPQLGDAVLIAKLAGVLTEGADGKEYRVVDDKSIVAVIEEDAP